MMTLEQRRKVTYMAVVLLIFGVIAIMSVVSYLEWPRWVAWLICFIGGALLSYYTADLTV